MHLRPDDAFVSSFDTVPYAFGVAEASVLPGPILTRLVGDLGLTVPASKALLHRMTQAGGLTMERTGRVGRYAMTGALLERFQEFRDGRPPRDPWDGRFHTIVYDIPEHDRLARDHLRTAAIRAGYRQVRPGVLIGPTDAAASLTPLAGANQLTTGWWTIDPDQVSGLVARCWDLDTIRARYETAVAATADLLTSDLERLAPADAYRTLHAAIRPVVALRLLDGPLPAELLPHDWPAGDLGRAFDRVAERLGVAAAAHVTGVIASSPHAGLVEADAAPRPC